MATLSDPRLPFRMKIPYGCTVTRTNNPLNHREPCISVKGNEFYLNLIWGPASYPVSDIPPPGYRLISRELIGRDDKEAVMITAEMLPSSFLMVAYLLLRSILYGIFFWMIGYVLMGLIQEKLGYGLWFGLVGFIFSLLKGQTRVLKYAFTYKDIEYVFTGDLSQKEKLDQSMRAIMFD